MLFNTFIYPFFLVGAVTLFWLTPKKWRLSSLLFSSAVFYGFNGLKFLALVLLLSAFTYWIGKRMQEVENKTQKKKHLWQGIVVIVLVLIFFKYSNLLVSTAKDLMGGNWEISKIFLPLGISFFTFEFIHYLVEMYYGRLPKHTLADFFSFALFFPTLASGPIKRFNKFFESTHDQSFSKNIFITGIFFILLGYAQKYFIADNLVEQTTFLSSPNIAPSSLAVLSGLFFYSFRIYFDFAGLSNIAIGSALLFGITVPINFSWPYLRKDLAGFWKYWHMSLTSWIRDYIYMPLVFRFRNSKFITSIAVIFTMGLIGLWHGSSWNFLFFGLYHGLGLAILQTKVFSFNPKFLPGWLKYGFGVIVTFGFVTLGWPFFVTSSLSDSLLLYQKIFAIFI
ncbi:MAG: MBOAT family protein [Candidatus Magasanikbacteria bacterium]|nr:MBOAT family protein [Candidatus Magasanikbacteria bacterium]